MDKSEFKSEVKRIYSFHIEKKEKAAVPIKNLVLGYELTVVHLVILALAYILAGLWLYNDAVNWSAHLLNSSLALFQIVDGGISGLTAAAMKDQIGFQLPDPSHFFWFCGLFSLILRKTFYRRFSFKWSNIFLLPALGMVTYLVLLIFHFGSVITITNSGLSVLVAYLCFCLPLLLRPVVDAPRADGDNTSIVLPSANWKTTFKILCGSYFGYLGILIVGIIVLGKLNLPLLGYASKSALLVFYAIAEYLLYFIWPRKVLKKVTIQRKQIKYLIFWVLSPWLLFLGLLVSLKVFNPLVASLALIVLSGTLVWLAGRDSLINQKTHSIPKLENEKQSKLTEKKLFKPLVFGMLALASILVLVGLPIYSEYLRVEKIPQPPALLKSVSEGLVNPQGYRWVKLKDFYPLISGNLGEYSVLLPQGYIRYKIKNSLLNDYIWGDPQDIEEVVAEKESVDFKLADHPIFYVSNQTQSIVDANGEIGDDSGPYTRETFNNMAQGLTLNSFVKGYFHGFQTVPIVSIVSLYENQLVYMTYIHSPIDNNLLLISLKGTRNTDENTLQWNKFVESLNIIDANATSTSATSTIQTNISTSQLSNLKTASPTP